MLSLNTPIILASKSPRRKQLLEQAGFDIEVRTKSIEENYPNHLRAEHVAPYLAEAKADACSDFLEEGKVLLAADTTVVLDQEILHKPVDFEDGKRILRALSGKCHLVVTGVCLRTPAKKRVISSTAKVWCDPLTDDEIEYYLNTFKPYDKAGAYAIQEWFGLTKISKIEGNYYTIVGLPVREVYRSVLEMNHKE